MSRYSVCITAFLIVPTDCTYMCPFISFSLLSLCSRLGCPLNRPLHIGGRTSPLPRVWCPHTVPVLGLDGRSGSNWQGPWLALCAGPLPCQLIGTASGRQRGRGVRQHFDWWMDTSVRKASFWQESLYSQFTVLASMGGVCIYVCFHPHLF